MNVLLSHFLDFARLLVVPLFAWAAYQDMETRRVPNKPWVYMAIIGTLLLLADAVLVFTDVPTHRFAPTFWRDVALSIAVMLPASYIGWYFGLFGGADAKALMALSIWFPVIPSYSLPEVLGGGIYPLYTFPISIFALTIFFNAVLLSMLYPLGTFLRNLLYGHFSWAMIIARPVPLSRLTDEHGIVYETPDGFGRSVDLDVLRQYLHWRDEPLESLTEFTAELDTDTETNTNTEADTDSVVARWGTDAFFKDTDELTYGESAESLARGLDHITTQQSVWVSPGIPYMVPFFFGLVWALTYGNLLFAVINAF